MYLSAPLVHSPPKFLMAFIEPRLLWHEWGRFMSILLYYHPYLYASFWMHHHYHHVMECSKVQSNPVQSSPIPSIQSDPIPIPSNAMQYNVIQCNAKQCNATQHNTIILPFSKRGGTTNSESHRTIQLLVSFQRAPAWKAANVLQWYKPFKLFISSSRGMLEQSLAYICPHISE